MRFTKKITALCLAAVFAAATVVPAAAAEVPYRGFTYNYWKETLPSPAAYVPTRSIGGSQINTSTGPAFEASLGGFSRPQDMHVDKNGIIYLLDTGNNRIVIFDKNLNLIRVIDSFKRGETTGKFNNPNGIFVTENLEIYIADTDNHRIVVLSNEGEFIKTIIDPKIKKSEDSEELYEFAPLKVCVDKADRVYANVKNIYEGLMYFNDAGVFQGYFGTISVNKSPMDILWRRLSTEAQQGKSALFIPVEFSSMDIDENGFIFTTNLDTWHGNKTVKRLNPSGSDVLINYTNLVINGDQIFRLTGRLGGGAVLVDIKTRPNGVYSVLDSVRSRLFTYDSEGNLLYVVGGTGNMLGMGRMPVAVDVLDDNLLILDQQRGEIVYYEQTEYGRLINEAIALRYSGDEVAAVGRWEKVLELNENYSLAYAGIGKALLAAGKNREAMDYLKKGMSMEYYSTAFKRYRNEFLQQNLSLILTLLAVLIAAFVAWRIYQNLKAKRLRLAAEKIANEALAERLKQRQIQLQEGRRQNE